jgi:2,5-diamino-6-(ribosylamino)-4(3H)-pyrimidinone 5'-phosphate reductase
MLPTIIIHNSVSIDGSLSNFEPHMELHYRIAGNYKPDAHLIGSHTIKAGIELYGDGVPPEKATDFQKPKRKKELPLWFIIDTKGTLTGLLHTCRRFEQNQDIILLVTESTPQTYLKHLTERNYPYHIVGSDHVDLKQMFLLLSKKYHVKTVLTDTGRILSNVLLNQGYGDEISLLMHPVIVGKDSYNMFSEIQKTKRFQLKKAEVLEKQYVWLVYNTDNK